MVLLEAMYHSKAAVVSNVMGSGMSWVVDDQITGLHVRPQDVASLRNSLIFLQKNRDKLRTFGLSGRRKFDAQYRIEFAAHGTSKLYEGLLGITSYGIN